MYVGIWNWCFVKWTKQQSWHLDCHYHERGTKTGAYHIQFVELYYYFFKELYNVIIRLIYVQVTDEKVNRGTNCGLKLPLHVPTVWTCTLYFQTERANKLLIEKSYWCTVQLRCNFMLACKQFIHTLEQFTQARIELLMASVSTCEELTQDY